MFRRSSIGSLNCVRGGGRRRREYFQKREMPHRKVQVYSDCIFCRSYMLIQSSLETAPEFPEFFSFSHHDFLFSII
jgi:hypothetical protein